MARLLTVALILLWATIAQAANPSYPNDVSTIPPNTVIANPNSWADTPTPFPMGMTVTRTAIVANDTTSTAIMLPANAVLRAIYIRNTTANVVTGGVDVGLTAGAADVVSAVAVGANALVIVTAGTTPALLVQWPSATATQLLFITAHTSWNSASLTVRFVYDQ